jgi:hypothetical protein
VRVIELKARHKPLLLVVVPHSPPPSQPCGLAAAVEAARGGAAEAVEGPGPSLVRRHCTSSVRLALEEPWA